jgi:hypothetical protein
MPNNYFVMLLIPIALKMSYLYSLSSARILNQLIALERAAVARWPAFRTHILRS